MAVKSVSMATVLVLIFTISHVEAKWFYTNCPEPQTIQSFSILRFSGSWFIHSVYYDPATPNPECYLAAFAAGPRTGQMAMAFGERKNGELLVRGGLNTATSGTGSDGKFRLVWADGKATNLYILDTDYKHYAYVLLCQNHGSGSERELWIMSGNLIAPDYYTMFKRKINANFRARSIKLMAKVPFSSCSQIRSLAVNALEV